MRKTRRRGNASDASLAGVFPFPCRVPLFLRDEHTRLTHTHTHTRVHTGRARFLAEGERFIFVRSRTLQGRITCARVLVARRIYLDAATGCARHVRSRRICKFDHRTDRRHQNWTIGIDSIDWLLLVKKRKGEGAPRESLSFGRYMLLVIALREESLQPLSLCISQHAGVVWLRIRNRTIKVYF